MTANNTKYLLIRPPAHVDAALKIAAHKRKINKVQIIERLLTIVVIDDIIDAVLDDDGSGEWNETNETSRLPT